MEETKTSVGSIIGIIIIIALIVLGGLYFWGKRIEESKNLPTNTVVNETVQLTPEQQEANAIKSMGTSDELKSIETDLKTTNLDNLDAELKTQ